jgi:hypothetical protein
MKLLCRDNLENCRSFAERLSAREIETVVRHDELPALLPEALPVLPELWLVRDADFDLAWAVLNREDGGEAVSTGDEAEPFSV